jgi:rhodanese-related sulfurtransferase
VTDFIVIDCRFEYEYSGGHIAGAVNLPTPEAVERHLLRDGEGAYASTSANLPPPSKSGEPDENGSTRKTVLIFHCEFSVKRAPTMYGHLFCFQHRSLTHLDDRAKHLRNRDRKLCSPVYPRVHYPDVYILQGGYAECFKRYPVGLCFWHGLRLWF